jgi:carboxyl-terminal processing protease
MTSRIRLLVLAVSTPVIAFAVVGGYLGQAAPRDETYRHLRVFEDVVSLVLNNYVEEVDIRTAMGGAMRGLADGLDADSSFLPPDVASAYESGAAARAEVGLDLSRQYYLRVIAARDGSPAARAGLRTGDFIRAIDGRPTRDMSAFEGMELLHGEAGSSVTLLVIRGNAADPHEITLVREPMAAPPVASRMAASGIGYVRVVEFSADASTQLTQAFDSLSRLGAARYIVDLRGTARGDLDDGIASARLFVSSGTLGVSEGKAQREVFSAAPGDGSITAPVALLVNQGTAGAAEVFAAALAGNNRADLIGERTLGRAARQRLVKLPDGSALLLSNVRYVAPGDTAIHDRGVEPGIRVDQPEVDFGVEPPPGDRTLERAIEHLTQERQAA